MNIRRNNPSMTPKEIADKRALIINELLASKFTDPRVKASLLEEVKRKAERKLA
jgi:hypothetical protein